MPYLFFFSLLILLFLSEPLSVTVSRQGDARRLYIRLIFFGMILSFFGHTDKKKQKKRKPRTKRTAHTRSLHTLRHAALADALRHLMPKTAFILEGVPMPDAKTPFSLGAGYTALSALHATLSSLFFYAEVRVREDEGTPMRLTLRACVLDVLASGAVFASSYIKRKMMSWQKHT